MGGDGMPRATGPYPGDLPWRRPAARSLETTRQRRTPWRGLRQLMPELRISNLRDPFPIRRPDHFDRWVDAMRKAGLPE